VSDFVYPVNDRDTDKWNDEIGVIDYFSGLRAGAMDTWYWSKAFRQVQAGDRVWVYAAAPYSRVIAVGVAVDDPQWSDKNAFWWVPVRWDLPVTRVLLDGDPPLLSHAPHAPQRLGEDDLDALLAWLDEVEAPDLAGLPAELVERYRQVRERQGQQDFRRKLIEAYGGRCAVTGCDEQSVLEAAHIEGYSGRNSTVSNGLLLRADIHTLFDAGLLWIDHQNRVRVAAEVGYKPYRQLDGNELRRPVNSEDWPDKEKLRAHRERARR
jgi:hypothetical protein